MSRQLAVITTTAAVLLLLGAATGASAAHIEPCAGPEDYRLADGRDYRGRVSTTVSGLTCQAWASNLPHRHETPIDPSLGTAGAGNNYCRNPFPNANDGPWCFTTSDTVRYERCNVGQPCNVATAPVVSAVRITPTTQVTTSPVLVTLATTTAGATIYYTTDNTAPREDVSPVYAGPFNASGTGVLTVRAFAVKDNMVSSAVAVRSYSLVPSPLAAPLVKPIVDPSVMSAVPILVSIENGDSSVAASAVTFFYTLDGTSPDSNSIRYTGPFWVKETSIVRAFGMADSRGASATTSQAYGVRAAQAPKPAVQPYLQPNSIVYGAIEFGFGSPVIGPEFSVTVNGGNKLSLTEANRLLSTSGASSSSTTLRVDRLGKYVLQVFASGSQTTYSEPVAMTFEVKPLPALQMLPAPGTYTGPTEVSVSLVGAASASGPVFALPIVVSINGTRVTTRTFTFDTVGTHTVEAHVETFSGPGPAVLGRYVLAPRTLAAPVVDPDPLLRFPLGFTFVAPLVLSLPPAPLPGTSYEVTVMNELQGSSRTVVVPADAAVSVELAASARATAVDRYVAVVRAIPSNANNAFLLSSASVRLEFRVTSAGDRATPLFLLDLARNPAVSGCAGLAGALNQALFLTAAGAASVGAQVVLLRCARRPAFSVIGLPPTALPDYTRFIATDLAAGAANASVLYRAAAAVGFGGPSATTSRVVAVDAPQYYASCTLVETANYFPYIESAVRVTPRSCALQCMGRTDMRTASVMLTNGGACACLSTITSPGAAVEAAQCGTACQADPTQTCGGVSNSRTLSVASQYGVIDVSSAGAAARLFPVAYSYRLPNAGGITTTSDFDVQLDAVNLPTQGVRVKFVMVDQTCSSLATESVVDQNGFAAGVLLQRAGEYRVCVAMPNSDGIDNADVFREVPAAAGAASATIRVATGTDVPVAITPDSTAAAVPLTVTITCPVAGATLIITVDGDAPIRVVASSYTVTLRHPGLHFVVAQATTSRAAIGLPVSRTYNLVDASASVPPPPPIGTDADAAAARLMGVQGYTYTLTTRHTVIGRVVADAAAWAAGPCAVVNGGCVFVVLPAAATTCAGAWPIATAVPNGSLPVLPIAAGLLVRATSADSVEFETESELDLQGAAFSRRPLRICVASNSAPTVIATVQPVALEWTISAATATLGECSAAQSAMCENGSACSLRATNFAINFSQAVCVCYTPDAVNRSVFCGDPMAVPVDWRDADFWDGSIFTKLTPSGQSPTPATPGDDQTQGSWLSLFVLVIIFAASTGGLWYYKTKVAKPISQ